MSATLTNPISLYEADRETLTTLLESRWAHIKQLEGAVREVRREADEWRVLYAAALANLRTLQLEERARIDDIMKQAEQRDGTIHQGITTVELEKADSDEAEHDGEEFWIHYERLTCKVSRKSPCV